MNVSIEKLIGNIYILSWHQIALLVAVGFACCVGTVRWADGWRYKRLLYGGLFAVWLWAVLNHTLFSRQPGEYEVHGQLFYSYRLALTENIEYFRECFMNSLMVFPGGVLLYLTLPEGKRRWLRLLLAVVLLGLLCAGIEYCQYRCCLGTAESDDVFHNTVGALLGGLAALAAERLSRKRRRN